MSGWSNTTIRSYSKLLETAKIILPLIATKPMTISELVKVTGLEYHYVYRWIDRITRHMPVWEDDAGRIGVLKE